MNLLLSCGEERSRAEEQVQVSKCGLNEEVKVELSLSLSTKLLSLSREAVQHMWAIDHAGLNSRRLSSESISRVTGAGNVTSSDNDTSESLINIPNIADDHH